jgi:hypothetical protein
MRKESNITPPPGLEPSESWATPPITGQSFFSDAFSPSSQSRVAASSSSGTPSISDDSSTPSSELTPDLSSGSDEFGPDEEEPEEPGEQFPLPSMELIVPHRRLSLPPSCFQHGCICGHQFEYRDTVYLHRRKNNRATKLTIHPKVAPISARLRRQE